MLYYTFTTIPSSSSSSSSSTRQSELPPYITGGATNESGIPSKTQFNESNTSENPASTPIVLKAWPKLVVGRSGANGAPAVRELSSIVMLLLLLFVVTLLLLSLLLVDAAVPVSWLLG